MTNSEPSATGPAPEPNPQPYQPFQPPYQPPYQAPYQPPYDAQHQPPYQPAASPDYPWAPYAGAPVASTAPVKTRKKRVLLGVGGAALAGALVLSGVGIGSAMNATNGSGAVAQAPATGNGSTGDGSTGNGSTGGSTGGSTTDPFGGSGFPSQQYGQGADTATSGTTATATQQAGIVTIVSTLKYQSAQAAGTGMILTANGEILTNNHVVDGATSIVVTDETTGKSYRATVVGTSPTQDVAVLQLSNASGLTTAKIGDSSDVAVGDKVTGVGNAGGSGTLTAVDGAVTALNQSITASDESGSNAEKLSGLIQTDADIVSGDSGGPLYDSAGEIVGINTAASTSNGATAMSSTAEAYAIPIDTAMKIADQIESGQETSTVHIGLPAFLGVAIADTTSGAGAGIGSVVSGGPADEANITAGSVVTAIDGKSVTSADSLQTVLQGYDPGQKVSVSWTDASGASHTATVTLAEGPAD